MGQVNILATETPVSETSVARLNFGSAQTPSSSVRSRYFPYIADQNAEIPRIPRPQRLGELGGLGTDDVGVRIRQGKFTSFSGTGPDLMVYPSRTLSPIVATHEPRPLLSPSHTQAIRWILESACLPDSKAAEIMGVSRMTIWNWKEGGAIRDGRRRRLLETQDILRRAMRLYSSNEELLSWLDRPDPETGVAPARLIQEEKFAQARLLAILSPTTVVPPPNWARHATTKARRELLEHADNVDEFSIDLLDSGDDY